MTRQLIINADDLGYDPAVTRGMLEAMRQGLVTSATFMVNTPFSEETAPLAHGLSLGLHLNLGRWAPVSSAIPDALLQNGEWAEARTAQLSAGMVKAETEAQLARLESLTGSRATHIDVHKHLHRHPAVFEGVLQVAAAQKLPVRALDAEMRRAMKARGVPCTDHFVGDAGAEAYWTLPRFIDALASLSDGLTELMCHPGYRPERVSSGYSAQREVELATLTSSAAREALATSGVRLVTFSALGAAAAV